MQHSNAIFLGERTCLFVICLCIMFFSLEALSRPNNHLKSKGKAAEKVGGGKTLLSISPSDRPLPYEWRNFQDSSPTLLMKLWQHHEKSGKDLQNWSWEWRMGWVKVCQTIPDPTCDRILHQALFDKALVVRAEAATKLGLRFEGSKNKNVVQILAKASQNKANYRGGNPLFVMHRILYALKLIDGEEASSAAQKITNKNASLKEYWLKLKK